MTSSCRLTCWISLVLCVIPAYLLNAATITSIEVNPKPAHAGQTVTFRIATTGGQADAIWSRMRITVAGEPITTTCLGSTERENGLTDWFLRGIAPQDFDWRQVKVRLDGSDYPAGPDDPYMICDAPFRLKSANATLPISVAFHDADNDDVQLQFVEVFDDDNGMLVASYPVWEWISAPFHSYLFDDLSAGNFGCAPGDTAWIKVVLHCDDHDIPFIPEEYTFTQYLKVRIGRDLPALPGWYYGDVHTHSSYTNNIYEYGGPLEMFSAAAEAIGLSFVTISDHSSDFDAAGQLWNQMANACAVYSTAAVHLIPAEEVNLDDNEVNNYIDNRIHFLNYSGYFIRGPEAPITFSMDTSDDFTKLSEALSSMEAGGGFGYAAHPFQAYDPFAYLFGLAMMPWSASNYELGLASSSFCGLELWNERNRYKKNVSYWYTLNPFPWADNPNWAFEYSWLTDGIAQWDEFLSQGLIENPVVPALLPRKLFVSAGSDCHGDFNYRTYNVDPIFYDVYATDNAFGNLRTAVYVPGYQPGQSPMQDEIITAYRLGRSFITDGPFLDIGIDRNGDGDLDDAIDLMIGDDETLYTDQIDSANVLLRWESTEDWGMVDSVYLFQGTVTTGADPEVLWSTAPNSYSGQESLTLSSLILIPTSGWVYLRAGVVGSLLPDDARRAFTNPIWLRVDETPLASISLEPQSLPILIPGNGGSFNFTIAVQNHQTGPVNCDLWLEAILPNGASYPLASVPITLAGQTSISRDRIQAVPSSAPQGDYAYMAYVGQYPSIWSSDGFAFSKMFGTNLPDQQENWGMSGLAFTAKDIVTSDGTTTRLADLKLSVAPNPFNLKSSFHLELESEAFVNLTIYNVGGQNVATLQNGPMTAGAHSIRWDGRDFPSGIYLYRLLSGDAVISGKMILAK